MNNTCVSLIGAPTDIGAGMLGAGMGPEALRVAGIAEAIAQFGIDAPQFDLAPEVRRFADLCAGGDPAPDQARTLATLRTLEAVRAVG